MSLKEKTNEILLGLDGVDRQEDGLPLINESDEVAIVKHIKDLVGEWSLESKQQVLDLLEAVQVSTGDDYYLAAVDTSNPYNDGDVFKSQIDGIADKYDQIFEDARYGDDSISPDYFSAPQNG
tara:strand:- start:156 stop:524 length:369 start_codon:yes stop_codon:yes gene_type:complete